MKKTVTFTDFMDEFQKCHRDNFSYEGYEALYNYFEEFNPDMELDVIEIDCSYVEYNDLEDFQDTYTREDYPDIESIEKETTIIKVGNSGFITQNF